MQNSRFSLVRAFSMFHWTLLLSAQPTSLHSMSLGRIFCIVIGDSSSICVASKDAENHPLLCFVGSATDERSEGLSLPDQMARSHSPTDYHYARRSISPADHSPLSTPLGHSSKKRQLPQIPPHSSRSGRGSERVCDAEMRGGVCCIGIFSLLFIDRDSFPAIHREGFLPSYS